MAHESSPNAPGTATEEEPCQPYDAALTSLPGQDGVPRPVSSGQMDSGGSAVLSPVPPGEYLIFSACSNDESFLYDPERLGRTADQAEKIRVQAGELKSVRVKNLPLP